jgi:hypothetical protein
MSWDFLVKTAAILGYFLQLHSGCVAAAAGGPWDVITAVPSSTDREGEHPLVGRSSCCRTSAINTRRYWSVARRPSRTHSQAIKASPPSGASTTSVSS